MPEQNKTANLHYIHRISSIVQERVVGLFVLSAILVIVGLILLQIQSSHLLDDRVYYHAYLANAQGISTETLVHISGIEVGRVQEIDITPENKIHVKFFVYDSFQRLLRSDSTGELNKLSLIGNAVIIIKAGSTLLPVLPAEATVPIEEPVSAEDLMAELTPVITSLKEIVRNVSALVGVIEPDELKQVMQNLSAFIENLNKVSEQLAAGKGPAGKILYDEKLEQNITRSIEGIEPIVKNTGELIKDTRKSMQQVEDILLETKRRLKEISRLIEPATEITDKSKDIASDLQTTTRLVNEEVQQLPEMVNKMQILLESTSRTLEGVQRIWPISTVVTPDSSQTVISEQPLDD